MGKRTSTTTPSGEPKVRKKPRTLLGTTIRVLAIMVVVLAVVFLASGWYFSNQIRDDALEPASAEPPDYNWTVVDSGATVSLEGSEGTDQAGQAGRSGIEWANGYAQSDELVSSEVSDGRVTDVHSIVDGQQGPPVGESARVDTYYYDGDPMTALGVPFETVQYPSDIGSFPAWYIEGDSDVWAIVVHGKGATLEEGLRLVPLFQDLGYHIMIIKYRNDVGEARDPSGYYQYGVTEWVDVAGAVTYARDNGAERHVLYGYSMGGAIVTSYLTQSPLRNFTEAAILDSPVLSFSDTVDFRASNTKVLGVTVPQQLADFSKWMASWRFDVDWEASNYLSQENLGNLHAPTLIIHGTQDESVPLSTSREMAERRPDIVTLVVTDAGHVRNWNIDPEGFDQTVKDFLEGLG